MAENVFAILVAMENALNFNTSVQFKKQTQWCTVTSGDWESETAKKEFAMSPGSWLGYS